MFHSNHYLRHTARRLEHLASLGLDLTNQRVFEPGAGIGDHTQFYLDRGCAVHASEPRLENLEEMRTRFEGNPKVTLEAIDLEAPPESSPGGFDIVHCYGLLYHLSDPTRAIRYLAGAAQRLMLVELCVSYGDEELLNTVEETQAHASQAVSGYGCRPTRPWVEARLREHFEHVYYPLTQPAHPEFPLDWTGAPPAASADNKMALSRAVFVASREPITNPLLTAERPSRQRLV
ncbi:MAG: class I SAM-dependent methyltransferase [Phycisphaerales bacterium]